MAKFKSLISGGGNAGIAVAKSMQDDGRAEPVAFFEPVAKQRAKLKAEFPNAEVGTDYLKLLEKHRPDIAVIAGPDHLHAEQGILAMEHGAHLLIEKPLATTVKDTKKLLAVEKKTGKKIMVDFTIRYAELWAAMVREAKAGTVGQVFFLQGNYIHDMWSYYNRKGENSTPWRADKKHPQNILLGGGCHGLDLMLWTMEGIPAKEVFCYSNHLSGSDLPIEDCYLVSILFKNGVIGKIFVTSGCNGAPWGPMLEVYGSKGTLLDGKLYRRGKKPATLKEGRKFGSKGGHGWPAAVTDFLDTLDGKIKNPVPSRIAANNVAICEAALISMRTGKPVRPENF